MNVTQAMQAFETYKYFLTCECNAFKTRGYVNL